MSHEERRQRRAQIADAIRNGATVAEVVKQFEVGMNAIRMACQEHGVTLSVRPIQPAAA